MTEEAHPQNPHGVVLTPGPVVDGQIATDAAILAMVNKQLDDVRSAADSWQKGLAGLLGLVSAVLVIKGPDTFSAISHGWQIGVAILLGVAALCAVGGMALVMDAAYGIPEEQHLDRLGDLAAVYGFQVARAKSRASSLKLGLAAFAVAVGLFGLGIIATWFAPAATPTFPGFVQTSGVCGNLESASNGQFMVVPDSKAKASVLTADDLKNLTVVAKCP